MPVRLSAELHGRLLTLAHIGGASLFMVLQAGLATLLTRLGAGLDIPIGAPIAGRGEPELEDLVGFFVNTLVMRTNVSGDPSFRELVSRVRAFALEAYAHQDVPFERVVEALQPARSLARHPLFQVMLVLQNTPESEVILPGLTIREEPLVGVVSKFDLTLALVESSGSDREPGGIVGEFEYSRDLFDTRTIETISARFTRLLEEATAKPDAPLHRLGILEAAERQELLEAFNATDSLAPERSLSELFEARVARDPEVVALVCGAASLSYGELNARANRLAHHLIGQGVGPEALVGICLDRSFDMVAALLAILKAGAAYVPIDPDLPALRRDALVSDSGLRHMLTAKAHRNLFVDRVGRLVILDENACDLASESEENPGVKSLPDNLAYLNYTSGTTGMPKAVLVSHIGVVRLVHEPNYVRLDPSCRLLQMAPLSFDAATFEIWGALLNGGTLVIMPPGPRSPQEIGEELIRHRVDTLWLTAGLFNAVVSFALPALAGVRQLLAGGDVLSADDVEQVRRAYPECQVLNGYGPTENTTFTCCYRVPRQSDLSAGVPIGFPINNTRVYVLDAGLEPLPVGVTGELYIAGLGLARGYLNRPGLTAERFVADPHAMAPGQRMYRTGDLARWRADGSLDFLGRVDHQVKLRGFRIELGEIEAALTEHPSIRQAVVVVREHAPGAKRLVAYVAPDGGADLDISELRKRLGEILPTYMIPDAFVTLPALPLTPNGKVDRRALPVEEITRPDLNVEFAPPACPREEKLARIWREVLRLDRVGIRDDFFDLGGHSLLLVQLWHRISQTFGQVHPLNLIYQNRTIEKMAALLKEDDHEEPHFDSRPSTAGSNGRPILFCLNYAANLASHLDDVPIIPLEDYDKVVRECDSIEEIARVSIKRMRRHQKEGPYRLTGFCAMGLVAFEMARILHQEGHEISLLALLDPSPASSTKTIRPYGLRYYADRLFFHASKAFRLHPTSWLTYCRERLSTIWRRLTAKTLEVAGRPVKNTQSRIEKAVVAYSPQVYPGRVSVLVSRGRVEESHGETDFGWSSLAAGGLDMRIIPGRHEMIFDEPNISTLDKVIQALYVESLSTSKSTSALEEATQLASA